MCSSRSPFICFILCLSLGLLLPTQGQAKSKNFAYKGFTGGMFLHTGYVQSKPFPIIVKEGITLQQQIKGVPIGIGGKLALLFGNHWRFGMEGYASSVRYGSTRSAFKIGWGGLLVEYIYPIQRYVPFVTLTLGGGGAKNMILLEKTKDDFTPLSVVYREYGFMAITPSLGCEFLMSKKMKIVLKADYLFSPTQEPDFASGFRIYLGFLFNNMR
ncbi:MAG: hypothetical protein RSC04_03130 [Bacteroidales bacterium]